MSVILATVAIGRADKANRIAQASLEAQVQVLPPPWSEAVKGPGNQLGFQNQTGRTVLVEDIWPEPRDGARRIVAPRVLPYRVENGDWLRVVSGSGSTSVEHVALIRWRYEDEVEARTNERRL